MAIKKRNVLITGGTRGLGLAIKEGLLASEFYNVFSPTRAELDLLNNKSIDTYFLNNDSFDVLINNAGINILGKIEDMTYDSMTQMVQTNLMAPLRLIQFVVPGMKKKKFGHIINISSIWGVSSKEYRTLYSATKFGLNGITKSLSRELGGFNILVNSICPGFVNTEMTKRNISDGEAKRLKSMIPLKRFAEPREIFDLVSFLISDKNSYITGQTIIIDGGFLH